MNELEKEVLALEKELKEAIRISREKVNILNNKNMMVLSKQEFITDAWIELHNKVTDTYNRFFANKQK